MMRVAELDQLRRNGVRFLTLGSWGWAFTLLTIGLVRGHGHSLTVFALAAAANVLPTIMALKGRGDLAARMTVGTLAAIMPALGVYLLTDHPWQMDAHMYFFVALAALTILYDWRPIALAAGLITAHHIVLDLAAPTWVFSEASNFGRIGIHALAVLIQQTGNLDHVKKVLRINVFVNSAADFTQQSEVADGASEVLYAVLGDAGAHTRTSVGVYQLPKGASVEVDMLVALEP